MSLFYRLLLIVACGFISIGVSAESLNVESTRNIIQMVYRLEEQGVFDEGAGSGDEISHYIAIVKADIKKNEVVLSYVQSGWFDRIWNFITQGATGAAAVGLSSYTNYLIFSELNEHVQSFNLWKEQRDLMSKVNDLQDE